MADHDALDAADKILNMHHVTTITMGRVANGGPSVELVERRLFDDLFEKSKILARTFTMLSTTPDRDNRRTMMDYQDRDRPPSGSEIHPAPTEFSNAQITADPILHFFHYSHLPPKLRATSRTFFMLAAHCVTTLPRNAERTVALRKLLEAKDAAVRANLVPGFTEQKPPVASEQPIGEPREIGGHDEDRDGPVKFDR